MNKKKKTIIVIIALLILPIIIVINIFEGNSIFNKNLLSYKKITAKEIYSRYKNISFSFPISLMDKQIITEKGSYKLEGDYECITIDTKYNVQLNLEDANITCNKGPAIYIKSANLVIINIKGNNNIISETSDIFDGAIYSKEDLIFTGDGSINIQSNYDGIVSKDSIIIKSGSYNIISQKNAIKGKDRVAIIDGKFIINASDGIKASNDSETGKGNIIIDNGTFIINNEKDAIQAKKDLIINNGHFTIKTYGDANLVSSKGLKAGNLLQISNGTYNIETMDDGIHTNYNLGLYGGNFTVTSNSDAIQADKLIILKDGLYKLNSRRGLVSSYIIINGGDTNIEASVAGIRASNRMGDNNVNVKINNGIVKMNIKSKGSYAIHSDGNIYMNGGRLTIKAKTPFYYGGIGKYNKGYIVINDKKITEIPNEMESIEELQKNWSPPLPENNK